MSMPFVTTWGVGTDEWTIDVQVTVASEEELQRHPPTAILSPIVDLANLAACGGLSGSKNDPQFAEAQILTQNIVAQRVQWVLKVRGVALSILKNVEGALLYFDSAIARVQSASIQAPAAYLSAKDQLPQRFFVPPPFQFVDDRQEFRSLVVEIAFEQTPRELMDRVEMEAFGIWICAASAGCFCDNYFPPQICKVYLGDHRYSRDSLILGLDEMILPEPVAIDSLINTLTWSHYKITKISSVELYD
ncbi:hypothetical protein NKI38_26660 [Mesorhizobium sp. M0621]|uniref:hypothetical protein n=1 Tax=Mesorhizobium sp. M0621 TaxID=2956974 RepID=UPI003338AE10